MNITLSNLDWEKSNGLLPAIVQNACTGDILMLGYMNQEAFEKTLHTKKVTFYSRSRRALWTKGDTSGNILELVDVLVDCDNDTLLVSANPTGPICHQGSATCFGEVGQTDWSFIQTLEAVIVEREKLRPDNSYTAKLINAGIDRIAQKVGEEGVEVALAAVAKNDAELCAEVADLLFHVLILLRAKKLNITEVIKVLKARHC